MKILALPTLLFSFLSLASCVIVIGGDGEGNRRVRGSGQRVEETREVEEFTSVKLIGCGDARIHVGAATALELSGDDNLLPLLETEVKNGTLVVKVPDNFRPRAELRLDISTPSLVRVDVFGSGDIEVLDVTGDELSLNLHGSGDLLARGSVKSVQASVGGSGDIELGDLHAEEASVEVRGSGNVDVFASQTLRYDIAGSGNVAIRGNPRLSGTISGSGSLQHH